MRILVLGAGYIGARVAELALDRGDEVVLADNWYATDRAQLAGLEERGARVETADIRVDENVARLLAEGVDRLFLLAAQASRPVSEREPDYTEETNATGVRLVAETVAARGGPPVVFGSSLHVYGAGLEGEVGPDRPYGPQTDLAHLTKIYGELILGLHSSPSNSLLQGRSGFELSVARLGVVYGPSPVEHDRADSVTVVDKFRLLATAGEEPTLDDGGRATIGVVHVEDAARALLEAEPGPSNVAGETITVADVARLARGEERCDVPAFTVASPYAYHHRVEEYLGP
jgi:nucleoside-diphosphate-sugar epimerase